jgi:hypothetical protein
MRSLLVRFVFLLTLFGVATHLIAPTVFDKQLSLLRWPR